MGSGLSAFDSGFLRDLNISTDGVKLKRSSKSSIPVVQPSKIVTYWEDLPCNKTLEELAVLTDLIRAITVRLINASFRSDYADFLQDIDSQLKDILRCYPGSEGNFTSEGGHSSRLCNIALIPATDEGIAFVRRVYGLLKGRQDELEAEKKRKEDDLNALLNGPLPPGNVFIVEIGYTPNKNYRRGRYFVWAENKVAAGRKALVKFHEEFPVVRAKNYLFKTFEIRIQKRGSWGRRWYFEHGGKCE